MAIAAVTPAAGRSAPGGPGSKVRLRQAYGPQTAVDVPRPLMAFGLITSTWNQ